MNGSDLRRLQRILLTLGVLTVGALWIAEDTGLLQIAPRSPSYSPELLLPVAPPPGLTLQGVIAGIGTAPAMALLGEPGRPPILVQEGQSYNEALQLARVLPDRVVLRQRGSPAPIVLQLAIDLSGDALPPVLETPRAAAAPPPPAARPSRAAPP